MWTPANGPTWHVVTMMGSEGRHAAIALVASVGRAMTHRHMIWARWHASSWHDAVVSRELRISPVCSRRLGVATAAMLLVTGCASNTPSAPQPTRAGLNCVDDSARCVQQRQATLRDMVSDTSRSWVRQPASARAYATGVRMFAYKKTKRSLNCAQLRHGRTEAAAAPSVLTGSIGQGLTPAQISRGKMFAGEVSRELKRELRRRCS